MASLKRATHRASCSALNGRAPSAAVPPHISLQRRKPSARRTTSPFSRSISRPPVFFSCNGSGSLLKGSLRVEARELRSEVRRQPCQDGLFGFGLRLAQRE